MSQSWSQSQEPKNPVVFTFSTFSGIGLVLGFDQMVSVLLH